jgi:hypothetical protein
MEYNVQFEQELPLNHEPSLDKWAKLRATEGMQDGCYTNWDHAYETEWMYLDAEFNYNYEYKG